MGASLYSNVFAISGLSGFSQSTFYSIIDKIKSRRAFLHPRLAYFVCQDIYICFVQIIGQLTNPSSNILLSIIKEPVLSIVSRMYWPSSLSSLSTLNTKIFPKGSLLEHPGMYLARNATHRIVWTSVFACEEAV